MGTIRKDLTGFTFGRLKVTGLNRQIDNIGTIWNCTCRCGNKVERETGTLTRGKASVKRCGRCYDEKKYCSEYRTWCSMLDRCYNSNNKWYARYGGRGIKVCDSWRDDFLNFLADLGRRPANLSLERKDNNGNYEPANCKWATASEQSYNRESYRKQ